MHIHRNYITRFQFELLLLVLIDGILTVIICQISTFSTSWGTVIMPNVIAVTPFM